ncbi:ER membrane glycoprotein subunit of the GPI transamidase complex-like protein, partial [Ascosphaera acerosa]
LLLAVALGAPGLGYDTSTALAAGIPLGGGDDNANGLGLGIRRGDRAVRRPALLSFARWDSIYFVEAARRGYVYEQEWAFRRNGLDGLAASEQWHALVVSGVLLSHLAHYASAVVLYLLGREVFSHERSSTDPDGAGRRQPASRVPLLAALLHVVSPAGVFLAAPNSEAAFALFSFAAMYAYAVSWRIGHGSGPPPRHASGCSAALLLASGLLLAIATLLRSNGLLSGCIFAYDFATLAVQLVRSRPKATAATTVLVGRMVALLVAGTLVFCAFAGPQVVAFLQFCTAPRRPWCHARIPSIYTFVQEHYWNVGLLRYWTLPNAPLFALA